MNSLVKNENNAVTKKSERLKAIKQLFLSRAQQEEKKFIQTQKKELTMLKKIAERLIGKPITSNCFANNIDLDSLMTGVLEEGGNTGTNMMREVQSKINKCLDVRRNSNILDEEQFLDD